VPEHLEALDRLGPTMHHRRFFAPVVAAREKHGSIASESVIAGVQFSETVEASVAAG
jgi:ribonuclease HII